LREAALIKMDLEFTARRWEREDPRSLLSNFSQVLKRTVPDKIPQVFLTSQHLLLSLCQGLFESLKKSDVQQTLDVLLPLFVERLGDVNARCSAAARDACLSLAQSPVVGPLYVSQWLLKPLKKDKKTVPSRVLVTRLQLLKQLAQDFGWQQKDGVPLEPAMTLAMQWFNNPSADVRNACVALVGSAYIGAGSSKVEPFLKDLRPAQRDVFDAEFDRLGYEDGYTPRSAREEEEEQPDEARRGEQCQFCGLQCTTALDMHYWKECPMLVQCIHCQQVVELMSMMEHLECECESRP
jgi:centrosomal protein CEP104